MNDTARIDKWLWAARIYKTRSIAADACKNGRITINGVNVKPSHTIKAGEVVSVKKSPITYSFKVLNEPYQWLRRQSTWNRTPNKEGPPSDGCLRRPCPIWF